MKARTLLDTTTLLVLALFAGCSDAGPPPSTAPATAGVRGLPVRPNGDLFTANAATTKVILPTGKGLGEMWNRQQRMGTENERAP